MAKLQKTEMRIRIVGWTSAWDMATTTVLFVGLFFAIFSAIGVTLAYGLAVLPGCVVIVLYKLFGKRGKKFVILGVAGLSVLLVAVNIPAIFGSVTSLVNAVVTTANGNLHWGFGSVSSLPKTGFADFALAAVPFLWVAVWLAASSNDIGLLFGGMSYVLVCICLGLFPHPVVSMVLFVGIVGKCVALKSIDWKKTLAVMSVAVLITVIAGSSLLYGGSRAVGSVRNGIYSAVEQVAYGEDSLPQGRLQKAQSMISEDLRLYVTVSPEIPILYLRGFVGSDLDGDEWQPTDRNAYVTEQSQGLLKYLANNNFPFGQYAEYLSICGKAVDETVEVQNVGANSKYAYAPYAVYQSNGVVNYDMNMYRGLVGSKTQTFRVAGPNISSEHLRSEEWAKAPYGTTERSDIYIKMDGQYRKFVQDTYLQIDESVRQMIISKLGGSGNDDVSAISGLIRNWYKDNFEYAAVPDVIGKNFASDFFGGSVHRANAAYFASAATLIFRAYGIPARYAEGYLVRAGELSQRTTLQVTGLNSHAWVEVYVDCMGWLPVEVTLNYFTDAMMDANQNTNGKPADGDLTPNVTPLPTEPQTPDEPIERPSFEPPEGTDEHDLYIAFNVLVPLLLATWVVLLAVLAAILRREHIIVGKHRRLEATGDGFGRAAISVLNHECRDMGGYSQKKADELGINPEDSARFVELVERNVYGGYELSYSEKMYVEGYIANVGEAISHSRGAAYRLYCKYFRCIGMYTNSNNYYAKKRQ